MWLICSRNYVIAGLEPFICVYSPCLPDHWDGNGGGPLTFETLKAWSAHMSFRHSKPYLQCMGPAHDPMVFEGWTPYLEHKKICKGCGGTIPGTEMPKVLECPFRDGDSKWCWECRDPAHDPIVFEQQIHYEEHLIKEHGLPEAHAKTLGNVFWRISPDYDLHLEPFEESRGHNWPSPALESHVAHHMTEIALLILQKLPYYEDAGNVDGDIITVDRRVITELLCRKESPLVSFMRRRNITMR
jgi:hypothetical protein